MKTVLIPTDFSNCSEKAIEYGTTMAKSLRADVILLHAYHPMPYAPEMYIYLGQDERDNLREEAERQLQQLSNRIEQATGSKCSHILEEGLPTTIIDSTINSVKPDLVVIGAKGMTAVGRALLGSVTAHVVRVSQVPVLVVPDKASFKPINRIVYATDYHDSDVEAIKFLAKIGKAHDSEITVLHVADGEIAMPFEEAYIKELESEFKMQADYSNVNFRVVENSHIAHAIQEYANDYKAELVAVAKMKRSVFLRVLLPSVTKKMIYHTDVPLLVFNAWDVPSEDF